MISVIRVLHVVGSLNAGGIETFLMSVYRQIDRSKVQFDFLVSSDQRFFYSDEIESLGGGIYPVEQSRYHPKATRYRLKQFYLENNTEIVHQHTGGLQTLMPLVAAEDAGVPTRVLHSHCAFVEPNSTKAQLEEVIHKLNTYRTGIATEKFACSADAAAYFGFDRYGGEWRYVPNGIDVGRFSFDMGKRKDARTELGLLDSTFLIGNIGRFSPQKNQAFLLRAFASVAKRCPDSKLLLVGVGPLEGDIHAEAERLGLTDRVIFLKNRSDTERLYAAMDVFAFPSLYEGLGIVLVEAQTNGLPCVISERIPREAVYGENVATVALEGGPEAWADAMLKSRAVARSQKGAELTRSAGFDISTVAASLQDFYLKAAERGARARG